MSTLVTQEEFKEWKDCVTVLEHTRKREMELRLKIATQIGQGKVGTYHKELFGNEVTVSTSEKINLTVKKEELTAHWNELDSKEKACFKTKVEIDKRNYEKLPEDSYVVQNWAERKLSTPTVKIIS
jgi:ribosomal protein L13